jgi:hypothetical protein
VGKMVSTLPFQHAIQGAKKRATLLKALLA